MSDMRNSLATFIVTGVSETMSASVRMFATSFALSACSNANIIPSSMSLLSSVNACSRPSNSSLSSGFRLSGAAGSFAASDSFPVYTGRLFGFGGVHLASFMTNGSVRQSSSVSPFVSENTRHL